MSIRLDLAQMGATNVLQCVLELALGDALSPPWRRECLLMVGDMLHRHAKNQMLLAR